MLLVNVISGTGKSSLLKCGLDFRGFRGYQTALKYFM